jgi:hypothetical protein
VRIWQLAEERLLEGADDLGDPLPVHAGRWRFRWKATPPGAGEVMVYGADDVYVETKVHVCKPTGV